MMRVRSDSSPSVEGRRYWKFGWNDLSALPPLGTPDYQPKDAGAFRMYQEGTFHGEHLEVFPAKKVKRFLQPFNRCVYCGRDKDERGESLKLTSEHVIPEYLGAGLEMPAASCLECQKITSEFEGALAQEIFDPIRKSFALQGKDGVLKKTNFPLDVGRETTQHEFIPVVHFPTIMVLPMLFPASSYSLRPTDFDEPFNFRVFNINADPIVLQRYALDTFSSQAIDMVRFAQLIAKIAHVYASSYFAPATFKSTVADFIRTNFPRGAPCNSHLEHVGCLWQRQDNASPNLHEIEVGTMDWHGRSMPAVRVRLFASCEMPSYYVTVGSF